MRRNVLLCLLLAILLLCLSATSSDYRIINADYMIMHEIAEKQYYTQLQGNVRFFYDDLEFFADQAQVYQDSGVATLTGAVKVKNDTLDVVSDYASYNRNSGVLELRNNVRVTVAQDTLTRVLEGQFVSWDRKSDVFNAVNQGKLTQIYPDHSIATFAADSMGFARHDGYVKAVRRCKVYYQKEELNGSCQSFYYNLNDEYALLLGSPEFTVTKNDSLHIQAERMEYFRKQGKVSAQFNVLAQGPDYHSTSEFLLYFTPEQKAVLLGEPRFFSADADGEATEFMLWVKDRRLDKAQLRDSCLVQFSSKKGGPKDNTIRSQHMLLGFDAGQLRSCTARDSVYSHVKTKERPDEPYAANAFSDSLKVQINTSHQINTVELFGRIKGRWGFYNKSFDKP